MIDLERQYTEEDIKNMNLEEAIEMEKILEAKRDMPFICPICLEETTQRRSYSEPLGFTYNSIPNICYGCFFAPLLRVAKQTLKSRKKINE